ncbi:calcium/calmodulin dependent protein kinase-like protein, partial [Aureobasidium melanogenum]
MSQAQIQPCRYKTGKTLGAGSYSVVKECVHIDTGRYYAAKVINKRLMAGREHMVRNEIAVLKRVSMGHQNILTLVDYFETMNNLYLVTDLALGGELFDRICRKGSYYESDAADLIRATLSAVAYLHDHGIVHRDLKPENLLFRTPEDNADLMIADFGLSRIMDEEQFHVLTTTCGTPGYMAPEIFNKSGHGKPVDVWAIGVITYFLLCGYTPFDRDSNLEEMQAILVADYSFTPLEYWRGVSLSARAFIKRCLTIDPTKRMTAHEALSHDWIAGPAQERGNEDLLPTVKKNFNARRTLHKAIDTVRAINQLRAGGGMGMMDGAQSHRPERFDTAAPKDKDGDVDMDSKPKNQTATAA